MQHARAMVDPRLRSVARDYELLANAVEIMVW